MRNIPCEVWSYATTSQGTTSSWREAWDRFFLCFGRDPGPANTWCHHLASWVVKKHIFVVLSYLLCGPLLYSSPRKLIPPHLGDGGQSNPLLYRLGEEHEMLEALCVDAHPTPAGGRSNSLRPPSLSSSQPLQFSQSFQALQFPQSLQPLQLQPLQFPQSLQPLQLLQPLQSSNPSSPVPHWPSDCLALPSRVARKTTTFCQYPLSWVITTYVRTVNPWLQPALFFPMRW